MQGKKFKHNAFVSFPETDKDLDDKDKSTKATKIKTYRENKGFGIIWFGDISETPFSPTELN